MDKYNMREWIASLEEMADNKLKKWAKEQKIENGEAVHLCWRFEQTHIRMDIFWEDAKETVRLKYVSPRVEQDFMWHGLTAITFNKVQDRIGNLGMSAMHPIKDPEELL